MQYDDRGKISLWKSDSEHPDAPVLNGTVVAHRAIAEGETLAIGLWRGESKHPRAPVFTGKMSDQYKKDEGHPKRAAPNPPPKQDDFVDDDLAF